jgi:type II restriction/modification system DNA methylase subunit YeeA
MSPDEFIAKWAAAELTERAAAQSHFIDLCALLDESTPTEADPKAEWYAFEKDAAKTTGGEGWADVWKRQCFGWEYKGKRKDLQAAFAQLQRYAIALENPPLLVVSDMERFEIHTNWTNTVVLTDGATVTIARDDETSFGVLHSRFREAWALRLGTSLEDRPRYTPSTTFETFPFPDGLTPNLPAAECEEDPRAIAIAEAARRLNEQREAWLNPPDLVERVPEVVPGFPDRIVPVDAKAAAILRRRTLTNLYNERPAWLDNAHRDLEAAVAAAYGWPTDITEEGALARLLDLNRARVAAGR